MRAAVELELAPAEAFGVLLEELGAGLSRLGLTLEPGPEGRILQGTEPVGRVAAWVGGERVRLEWRPAPWDEEIVTSVELAVEPLDGGCRATLEHRGWARVVGGGAELGGWFAREVAAPLLRAAAPAALGDWLTDRGARRPSGPASRAVYGDPLYHYPNFRVLLSELALKPSDHLLEVGCGGGALLRDALASGCRAAAVDHSPDMVRLARETNATAVAAGRLEVVEGAAERLPFPGDTFSKATMTGVLGFLADPVAALAEIRRVLRPGGRFVGLGSDPELRGTPAAPEPFASRLRFYGEDELERMAREAGFTTVIVVRRELATFARDAGVPREHLFLFEGPGARFLLARKG